MSRAYWIWVACEVLLLLVGLAIVIRDSLSPLSPPPIYVHVTGGDWMNHPPKGMKYCASGFDHSVERCADGSVPTDTPPPASDPTKESR